MVHKLVNIGFYVYDIIFKVRMSKSFVYGKSVDGDNFTDRVKETHRLQKNFYYICSVIEIFCLASNCNTKLSGKSDTTKFWTTFSCSRY